RKLPWVESSEPGGGGLMPAARIHPFRRWLTLALLLSVTALPLARAAAPKEMATLKGHTCWVGALVFSPDGKTLATAGADNVVRLWNVATGETSTTLKGHEDYVCAVAFSPDGKTLATGSYDKTAKLWDVTGARERRTLRGHGGVVMAVAFSPDAKTLA